jgi:hypothetical protein
MTDIICPLCGKPNPPELDECKFCQAPLKAAGFLAPSDQEGGEDQFISPIGVPDEVESPTVKSEPATPLEQAIPDWLKDTEAGFLEGVESKPEQPISEDISAQIESLINPPSVPDNAAQPAIDDDWLASLLAEAGNEPLSLMPQEEQPGGQAEESNTNITEPFTETPSDEEEVLPSRQIEKPDWLTGLEAASTIKLAGEIIPGEPTGIDAGIIEPEAETGPSQMDVPDWIGQTDTLESPASQQEPEPSIAPAELPSWLEALRPEETAAPTGPVEDLSAADIVTAGPLVGLKGVISARPSAIRARKPPTYSIKLRVTDEQRARVEMMEALLADEQKPKPVPTQPILTSRNIFRMVIAAVLILPIVWMIITASQRILPPQPGSIPGVVDFTEQIQKLPVGAPVILAFDYEPGFSGEMNPAVSSLISQLMIKNVYMTLVTTTTSGPALAESIIKTSATSAGMTGSYSHYTDLGYIPGGTLGLLGLANSPMTVLPYSLDDSDVWASAPLDTISTINDFAAVIVLTNDPDIARSWIEQVGSVLKEDATPLLIVTSSQAEPLLRPYYQAYPAQVQGMVAGLAGGLAYGRTVGNIQQNGVWDAYSIAITVSALIILVGSIIGVVMKMPASDKKKESKE